ncbi:MAG TPA: 50S ribosomal protein L27 [Nannocystaceae bacterium]|nr:50S ribosomal protein L27 [Nannocystaceae bacterium]
MAHKKGQGSIKNGRDSQAQRRGVKKFGGEQVRAGNIIIRQVGGTVRAGRGVGQGKDFTLFALIDGTVRYYKRGRERQAYVAVDAVATEAAAAAE